MIGQLITTSGPSTSEIRQGDKIDDSTLINNLSG